MAHGLSKSRLLEWRQCPKRLWLKVHRPDLIETAPQTERAFSIGYEIGDVARKLHPGGVLIDTDDLREALRVTKTLLATQPGVPIFEATFEREDVLVRADLLLPEEGDYRMVEVKAATSLKDYYVEDAAIQSWVVGNQVRLNAVEVAHVDSQFVYPGDGDYRGLFKHVAVDESIAALAPEIPDWIASARLTLSGAEPVVVTGKQCGDPFECPFVGYCNAAVPVAEYPLSALQRLSARRREQLEAQGIIDVRQVPDDFLLSDLQARIRRVSIEGKAELLADAAKQLASLPYPRYYLDFETVKMAVPIWANTRLYQNVPVQWSCHVETEPGTIQRSAFLAEGLDDPRRAFARSMIEALGMDGPIFVYNQSFELGRIRELIRDLPHLADQLTDIADRVVDLLPITRENYCHPAMMGSWSIKSVLPTIAADLDYKAMEIGDGGEAEQSWLEILHPATTKERRIALRQSLAEYCALDTLAMVRLAAFLLGAARS